MAPADDDGGEAAAACAPPPPPRDKRGRSASPADAGHDEAKKRRTDEGGDGPGPSAASAPDDDAGVEAELEARRARAREWQAARRAAEEAGAAEEGEKAGPGDGDGGGGWSDDDDAGGGLAAAAARARAVAAAASLAEDEEARAAAESASGGAGPPPPPPTDAPMPAADPDDDDEVDPLDAFMADNDAAAEEALRAARAEPAAAPAAGAAPPPPPRRRARAPSSSSDGAAAPDSDDESDTGAARGPEVSDAEWARGVATGAGAKGDKLAAVDHAAIDYPPFRRKFYIEAPDLAKMTDEDAAALRASLDGVRVRGAGAPRPLRSWNQAGLPTRVLEALKRAGAVSPLPVQAQALPVIMGGRDCIGVAKTGSGKTLAFLLPALRHVRDQPPLAPGDGPIALVLAPTRELVQQIARDARRLARAVGLTVVAAYGGSSLGTQISDLKRGAEIVVATPGRLIDVLSMSGGRVTNLRRVTYLVLDEADRMFDMGFEPQITRIVAGVRPDRQTVMFSATFPRSVETLARGLLVNPIEVSVGGKSVVNADVTQIVEVRPKEERFLRLLELLGEWFERGKILVFVASQDGCDALFRDLLRVGYPCLSLHGGKDQGDRQSTVADFKSDVCPLLIATSVAARGLDVPGLVLVVNYDPPNHMEDYVHRAGRTGRAGAKGTAITFLSPDDPSSAPDVVRALRDAGAPVPADVAALADAHRAAVKAGTAKSRGGGFGGSGFKFDAAEADAVKAARSDAARAARAAAGLDEDAVEDGRRKKDDEAGDDGGVTEVGAPRAAEPAPAAPAPVAPAPAAPAAAAMAAAAIAAAAARVVAAAKPGEGEATTTAAPKPAAPAPAPARPPAMAAAIAAAKAAAARVAKGNKAGGAVIAAPTPAVSSDPMLAAARAAAAATAPDPMLAAARAAAAAVAAATAAGGAPPSDPDRPRHFQAELDINDCPQTARWKACHRSTTDAVLEATGAAVIAKGVFVDRGGILPPGERKMYLLIQGATAAGVREAKSMLKRVIEEYTEKALRREGGAAGPAIGKYNVL
jgi:ATP-dependent RNA helicase DDX46/PRP5